MSWDYGSYTWHTNRDTYDKIVFDDLRFNATLTAMLAYLAANDATTITRERATAEQIRPQGGGAVPAPVAAARSRGPRVRRRHVRRIRGCGRRSGLGPNDEPPCHRPAWR